MSVRQKQTVSMVSKGQNDLLFDRLQAGDTLTFKELDTQWWEGKKNVRANVLEVTVTIRPATDNEIEYAINN